jgi:hypothetical protein
MRPERDIERVLDAWLAPGPSEMPDRLLAEAFERIERVPQRRPRWRARSIPRSNLSVPMAAAVAVLALGLAAITLLQAPPDARQASEASARPSPVAASGRDPAPPELQDSWAGSPRVVSGLDLSPSVARWRIAAGGFRLVDQDLDLAAVATAAGPGRLRLESLSGRGCHRGDVGTYAWSLDGDAEGVTFSALDDDCAARASLLSGRWFRMDCDLRPGSCRGPLAPGRHASVLFEPRGGADVQPVARPGGLSFDLPEGWADAQDDVSALRLTPAAAYERHLGDAGTDVDQIAVYPRARALRADGPRCEIREDPAGGTTLESLAAWLTTRADVLASQPQPVTIDGHTGVSIDVDLAPGPGGGCRILFGTPGVVLFADARSIDADGLLVDRPAWGFGTGFQCSDCTWDPKRVILLDLDGEPLVILVDSERPEDQAAFVEQAMPIVESFRFPA